MPNNKTVVAYTGTQEQEQRLQQVIEQYRGVPGGTMPVLQKAQEIFGYLPEQVQRIIADGLSMSLEDVYKIASFYSLFTMNPKGAFRVSVCLGTACYVKGSQQILDRINEKLDCQTGSISKDGRFSVDATRCVGACGLAPVMTINDDVYGRMTPGMVDEILDKYK